MFGYIKPYKPEMKIKDYDVFKAYYCGLCKEIGKRYGELSRFTLSYELTYLAIFLSALSDEKIFFEVEGCIANPFKKKPIIKENPFIQYAADMNSILMYYKLLDMKKDEKNVLSDIIPLIFYSKFKIAYEKYPLKSDIIKKHLIELDNLEKEKCDSVDIAAEPFANILKEVFKYDGLDLNDTDIKKIDDIAYNLGRFIYIIDAYNDIDDDIKKGNYNPFIIQFNYTTENSLQMNSTKKEIDKWVSFDLTYTLSTIVKAYEGLRFKKNKGIIDNIFRIGLYMEFKRILEGEKTCEVHMKY